MLNVSWVGGFKLLIVWLEAVILYTKQHPKAINHMDIAIYSDCSTREQVETFRYQFSNVKNYEMVS